MFNSIASFFMSIIIFIMNLFVPAVPEVKTMDEIVPLADICQEYELPEKLYVLDSATFETQEERHLAVSLQGIVAKTKPYIYIVTNSMDNRYLEEIEKSGIELVRTDENGEKWTVESLLAKFIDCIGDGGYVLYRESEKAEGLNMATNLASIFGWLPVHTSLEDIAVSAGLEKKEDFSESNYNLSFQKKFFNEYKEYFNYNALAHLKYDVSGLRDLAIQQGFFVFYIDDDIVGSQMFRNNVMDYAGDNTPVLGWVKYEVNFVDNASAQGNMALPSDHSHNNSFLASFKCEIPEQKAVKNTYTDGSKHYCAIVFSDGDNLQWIQNGYKEFYQKLALENNFPITWSFAPLLSDFSSLTTKTIYSDASEMDYFMAGVSGAGYMHPTQYPKDALAGFTDMTAAAMSNSNMKYVQILDSTPDNAVEEEKLINALEYYARYDTIQGGVLSLDPTRYEGGKGRVYFVNDKPFVSYRLSLWYPGGEGSEVPREWFDEQAATVNSYPADMNSINGYSIINVHPWTVSVEELAYFVSQLDDDVVLVTVDEIMTMISENVEHKNAKPE